MKHRLTALLAAVALALPAFAMAQQPTEPPEPDELDRPTEQREFDSRYQPESATRSDALTRLEPGLIKIAKLRGAKVASLEEEEIGTIDDLVIDQTGRIAAVVLRTGAMMGLGGRKVALPWHMVEVIPDAERPDEYRVRLAMGAEELNNQPDFDEKGGSMEQ